MSGEEIKAEINKLENQLNLLASQYNLIYDIDIIDNGTYNHRYSRIYIKTSTTLR